MASHRFKSYNLKRLHINAIKEEKQDPNAKTEEENEPLPIVKSAVLDRMNATYEAHHSHYSYHQVHHHSQDKAQEQQQEDQQRQQQRQLSKATQLSTHPSNHSDSPHHFRSAVENHISIQPRVQKGTTKLRLPDTKVSGGFDRICICICEEMAKTIQFPSNSESTRSHLKISPPLLLPQGPKAATSYKVKDRMKDSRLRGSDLYVARLCWKKTGDDQYSHKNRRDIKPSVTDDMEPTSKTPPSLGQSPTGSLHEELRCCKSPDEKTGAQGLQLLARQPMATQSRPCYRCIFYMHAVGIKRVFWTNTKGEWEGAKVQELVDNLENAADHPSGKGTSGGGGNACS